MIRISDVKIPVTETRGSLAEKIKNMYGIKDMTFFRIARKAVDARKKSDVHFVYSFDIGTEDEDAYLQKHAGKNISKIEEKDFFLAANRIVKDPIVIIGFGPAGFMSALALSRAGYKVIVLERGKDIDSRTADVSVFAGRGEFNSGSNVQFGEGGAGTFSDGKLTCGKNDYRIKYILNELYKHGAPEDILYDAKPHIGTDKLVSVVKNIRGEIIKNGGEVRFGSRAAEIITKNGAVTGVRVAADGSEYIEKTEHVILAAGQSACDTYEMLAECSVEMAQKPFSLGCRVEHPQSLINESQYGAAARFLGAADYKLAVHLSSGRGVYTFCMCPGGEVIASSSEEGTIVTNGMSRYKRDGKNANSALLVGTNPADFGGSDPLAGIYMRRDIEQRAFAAGGGDYKAVSMYIGDFLGKEFRGEKVEPTYKPGVVFRDAEGILPQFVMGSLKEALPMMGKKLRGFDMSGAVMTFPETRSSSPVRIVRDSETMQTNIAGIYPCGEGAGYAGGIISSAVDALKIAEAIVSR